MSTTERADGDAPFDLDDHDPHIYADLSPVHAAILLISISIVALCGIVYELIIGTVSSYLLGNSVYQFSITIGFFMFAMGIGSYLSKFIGGNLIARFIHVEMVLALIGGICSLALFFAFPFAPFLYQLVMFFFIFTIGALVGLEIPLLTRILAQGSGTRRSIANVMSLDYIGALIGSVAFPLMLLPNLGLVRSSFAIGLINIFVAVLNVIYLRQYLPNPGRLLALIFGVLGFLVLLLFLGTRLTSMAQDNLYFDQVIWKKQTQYQSLVVTNNWQRGDLRLFIDGHIQFSEADEHRYHEALVHPVMSYPGKSERLLVLGGGDGLALREILKYGHVKQIDLVDIDPQMTDLGRDFSPLVKLNAGALHDPRVKIYNTDAFIFINRPGPLYDRVFLDFPDPHNEAISKLYSVEFYTMLKRRMAPDGVMITQSSSPFFARRTYWSIERTLAAVFPATLSFNLPVPAFGLWGFNIAAMQHGAGAGAISVPTRYLTDDVFKASQVFGKDIARLPEPQPVNTIFEPILYQLYLEDQRSSIKMLSPNPPNAS
ncbi:MAG: polyamine aminopropyltransferase [Alphaproteobacteria bacterium]|nr:polyamine aminopropyltransferase [Alphaproteobacteria bacterium]